MLNTEGPNGQVLKMRFSNDSKRLYVAGRDKTVHQWNVAGGIAREENGPARLVYASALRWQLVRGNRGQVFDLAMHPEREEMIIGGMCAEQITGDLAVFNLNNEEVVASLPSKPARELNKRANGHTEVVNAISYSPSGNKVLSIDASGRIFLWTRGTGGIWSGKEVSGPASYKLEFPLVQFISETRYVTESRNSTGSVQLAEFDLTGKKVGYHRDRFTSLSALSNSGQGFWAVGDLAGKLVFKGLNKEFKSWKFQTQFPEINAIAFGPNGLAAVASNQQVTTGKNVTSVNSCIQLIDTIQQREIDRREFPQRLSAIRSIAISPDGSLLATHNDERREVRLFRMQDAKGVYLTRPLQALTPNYAAGLSKPVVAVGFSPDGKSVLFGDQPSSFSHSVSFASGRVATIEDEALPHSVDARWADWDVRLPGNSKVGVVSDTGKEWQISVDQRLQGKVVEFAFIGTGARPSAVAVGADLVNGIYIYSLPSDGSAPRLLRWFYDHNDTVASLAVSPDQKMLVSGSYDGTLKMWDLRGIFARDPAFSSQSIWGASFQREQAGLIIRRVDPAGIAYAKGYRDGDRVIEIYGESRTQTGKIYYLRGEDATVAAMHAALEDINPFQEVFLQFADGMKVVRPGWEPIVTVYRDRRDEWAIWHPRGYFDSSPAEGGNLFGWLFNLGPDQTPRVLRASQLQKEFERPDIIRGLLSGQTIDRVLAGRNEQGKSLGRIGQQVPEVKIVSPLTTQPVPANGRTTLVAQVTFPERNRGDYTVVASINGFRLGSPEGEQQGGLESWEFRWPCALTSELNQVEVMVSERGGALNALYDTAQVTLRGVPLNDQRYRLHLLLLGSKQYGDEASQSDTKLPPLDFPIDDIDEVRSRLARYHTEKKSAYEQGKWIRLVDQEITRESVSKSIDALQQAIERDYSGDRNVLVVYLAGHGLTVDSEYHYVTVHARDSSDAAVKATGIPWSLLSEAGSENCQVVYMIDTCHSGVAAQELASDAVIRDRKSAVRDPIRSQGIVISAATGTDPALEVSRLRHGIFSFTVLQALAGGADGYVRSPRGRVRKEEDAVDNRVDFTELIHFVASQTEQLAQGKQRPVVAPQRLLETFELPMVNLVP
ncbi:caspase family protein [Planctomycetaceae bacterium SH139]